MKIIVFSLLILPKVSIGYEIGQKAEKNVNSPSFSTDKSIIGQWERNHERLTALSLECLAIKNIGDPLLSKKPELCDLSDIDTTDFSVFTTDYGASPSKIQEYFTLLKTVRWPDDPSRQVYEHDRSSPKFGANMKKVCEDRVENFDDIILTRDGLLCNSHFGPLQFLHSQSPNDGDDYARTKDKMTDWAQYAFSISKGNENLNDNYYDYWNGNSDYPNIVASMQADAIKEWGWHEDKKIPWYFYYPFSAAWKDVDGIWPAWTIGSMFSQECLASIQSASCNIITSESEIRFSALGSIIHMIQDSYSASHTNRGATSKSPQIICQPVAEFYSYRNQNGDKHTESDKWPTIECSKDNGTLDPITAVAQIIWLHNNPSGTREDIRDVLLKVLGHSAKTQKSGPGSFYGKSD
jgi:hypothetical protein